MLTAAEATALRVFGDHGAMLTPNLLAYVRSSLPEPPSRILEIGAGQGELAGELREAGWEVTAIDPSENSGPGVERIPLLDARGSFDAAVAVVSLHHIDPLEESCAHLATLIGPGGRLVIDELDLARYDDRAVDWWVAQRRTLGPVDHDLDRDRILEMLRSHIHPLATVCAALEPYFELGEPVPGPYLHRWELRPSLEAVEVGLIAEGLLPAVGARLIATRRNS
jgi:SAM-dependent methyltransferase